MNRGEIVTVQKTQMVLFQPKVKKKPEGVLPLPHPNTFPHWNSVFPLDGVAAILPIVKEVKKSQSWSHQNGPHAPRRPLGTAC